MGDTTTLGPLARTDLCAGVKGLLDRLMTHFGLGSSKEDPGGKPVKGVGVGLPSQEPVLPVWEAVLFPWEALCLTEHQDACLTDLDIPLLPAWLEGQLLPAWEGFSLAGVLVMTLLPAWEEGLSLGVVLGLTVLPAWKEVPSPGRGETTCVACLPEEPLTCFLPQREGEQLPACLPEWPEMPLNCFLPWGEGEHLPDCLPGKLIYCFLP